MKRLPLLFSAAVIVSILSVSCAGSGAGGPSMAPIGEGLRFLGVALVVAMLVLVLGSMRRGGGPHG